MKQDEVAY